MIIGIEGSWNPFRVERRYYILDDQIYNNWISKGLPEREDILTLDDGAILRYQSHGRFKCEYFELVQTAFDCDREQVSAFLKRTEYLDKSTSDYYGDLCDSD